MADIATAIEEPIDLLHLSLKEKIFVKCRFGRELRGKLIVLLFYYTYLYIHDMCRPMMSI